MYRVGQGIDFHCFKEGNFIMLGGIKIPFDKGIEAHSDGDILIHSLMDAILGAMGLEDIGEHFPDTDPNYKGISSSLLLHKVLLKMKNSAYSIENIDITILAELPKIKPYRTQIIDNLCRFISIDKTQISLKATTTEKMGFIGQGEGLCCSSVILLKKI